MALPSTITSNAQPGGYSPPFKSSQGAFYAVAFVGGTGDIGVFKSTDPTAASNPWGTGDLDSSNRPSNANLGNNDTIAVRQKGDTLHIAYHTANDGLYYARFDMHNGTSGDTWNTSHSAVGQIDSSNVGYGAASADIAVLSNDDIVIVAQTIEESVKGKDRGRIDYHYWDESVGTSWSANNALDAAGAVSYTMGKCILSKSGTNDVHAAWLTGSQFDGASNVESTGIQGRTIRSGGASLSTTQTHGTTISDFAHRGVTSMVAWTDGSTERIGVFVEDAGKLSFARTTEDASDDLAAWASGLTAVSDNDVRLNVESFNTWYVASCFEDSGDIYLIYGGGGTAGVDRDIYYTKSTGAGTSWDTDTEALDAVTADTVEGTVYDRSGSKLAYVYDDNGTFKYNEISLATPPKTASGSVTLGEATASGSVTQTLKPSGSTTLEAATASGSVEQTLKPSGAATADALTASGTAALALNADGDATLASPTASGEAGLLREADGDATLATLTASGTATKFALRTAAGDATAPVATASGTVTQTYKVSGSITIEAPEASGVVSQTYLAIGSANTPQPTASGTAFQTLKASGTATLNQATASGTATKTGLKEASGDADVTGPTASGSVTQTQYAAGAATLAQSTASGVAEKTGEAKTASGDADVSGPTASGSAHQILYATGDATLNEFSASGTVTQTQFVSGAITLDFVSASGTSIKFGEKTASGNSSLSNITAAGNAFLTRFATGSVVTDQITASANVTQTQFAVGNVFAPSLINAASGTAIIALDATGSPDLDEITASGTVTQHQYVTGDAYLDALTASGVANAVGLRAATGDATLDTITASGLALIAAEQPHIHHMHSFLKPMLS